MKNFLTFLAFVQAAVGIAVVRDTDSVHSVTLNVGNKQLAPDGFSRSTRSPSYFIYGTEILTTFCF